MRKLNISSELVPEHRSLEPPKHFPSYHDIKPTYSEPRYVADMPHLPPPPEMIDMQRNSLFPVDVPKIGVDVPYRPPELVFDELHRKQHFKRQVSSFLLLKLTLRLRSASIRYARSESGSGIKYL